ncbi:MAG: molybdenum cofactor guanylyltransferase [Nitrospirales bacterium]
MESEPGRAGPSETLGGISDTTAVLLAGGKSRRMGRDKRFIELEGKTLLERALGTLEAVFPEVLIAVAEPSPDLAGLGHRVVTDVIPGRATLGGLLTGITLATSSRVFAVACDMPLLNPEVIRAMATVDRQADVVMAQLEGGLQPMHAFYRKTCLGHLERMARGGHLKVQDICQVPDLAVRLVGEAELRKVDPQLLSFLNVNTPADLEFVRKLLCAQHASPRHTT